MVPDVYAACKRYGWWNEELSYLFEIPQFIYVTRFEELNVDFVKKPDDGRMRGLAFVKDPDGYWIEIFNANTVVQWKRLSLKNFI